MKKRRLVLYLVIIIILSIGLVINNKLVNYSYCHKIKSEWLEYSKYYKTTNNLILTLTKNDYKTQGKNDKNVSRYIHTFKYEDYKIVGLSGFKYNFTNKDIENFNKMNQFFEKRKALIDFIFIEKNRVSYALDGSPMIVYSPDKVPDYYFGGDNDLKFRVIKLEKDWYFLKGDVPR